MNTTPGWGCYAAWRDLEVARVKRRVRAAVGICLAGMLMAGREARNSFCAQPDSTAKTFRGVVKPGEPGLAVLIRRAGHDIYRQGFGLRDLRTRTPIDARTNFRLASLTKQFTAMGIMLLVHDGKLGYEQRLTEVFSDFPPYGQGISIRNLLNHTGGLPDYEDLMDAVEKKRGAQWNAEHQIQDGEVLGLLQQQTKGAFAPGTDWAYSNSGYVVLGTIIARISGEPYGDFLRRRIFAPLGMDGTVVYVKGKNQVLDRAYGYARESGGFAETDQSATSATLGDGGMYSNLEDLAKWDDALRRHTLLGEEEMKPALTPAVLADGSEPRQAAEASDGEARPVSYGFGWFLDPYKTPGSHARMWHTGETSGFRTVMERFTGEPLTVIILCNRTDIDAGKLSLEAAEPFLSSTQN
jgi:CubicO group peptidase (beta-lactamase class C family)